MSAGGAAPVAVVFDLDGVLVDSRRAITASIRHALTSNGHPDQPSASLERFIGPPLSLTMAELTGAPIASAANDALVGAYREHYGATLHAGTDLMPGIADALDRLGRDHVLAVATAKPRVFSEPLLQALGLGGAFAHVAAPDASVRVPDKADAVREAMQAIGAERGVMVGDRAVDVVGGHANGMPVVGALWGFGSRDELEQAGADALAHDATELPGLVAALLSGDLPRLRPCAS
jgi:phosphoglycolate phosphatase